MSTTPPASPGSASPLYPSARAGHNHGAGGIGRVQASAAAADTPQRQGPAPEYLSAPRAPAPGERLFGRAVLDDELPDLEQRIHRTMARSPQDLSTSWTQTHLREFL